MPRPRVSAISFLNTAPLMWDFERTPLGREYDISYTIPSLCAEALRSGAADIGLIPAVTYFSIPNLVILPDVCIAAKDAVRSILLIARKPLEEVETVAADVSSRTSVVLCDLLLRRWFPANAKGAPREFTRAEPDLDAMLAAHDAALLIGDSALRVDATRYGVFDLAAEWRRMTGKPFVFAFWAVRAEALQPNMPAHFRLSRDHGLQPASIDVLAREWAPRVGISEEAVRGYLTESISFQLDAENLAGLHLFLRYAAEERLLPPAPELGFLGLANSDSPAVHRGKY
ncbi:MAG TPA: menaquinone biosynthesis protein [Terriglobales bacterium]|nr:menaquinone biosynthesis protein [Terriglobales bacterium]